VKGNSERPRLSRFSSLYIMLGLDVVLPLIAVQVMLRAGQSPVAALSLAALFPFADTLVLTITAQFASRYPTRFGFTEAARCSPLVKASLVPPGRLN
jgi:hypothetical protein